MRPWRFSAFLELLRKRAQFEFHRPGATILMREVPIGFRDGVGTKQIFFARVGSLPVRQIDPAIDVYPGHVDPLRAEVSGQRLGQSPLGKIARPERDRLRARLDAGGRSGEEDRAPAASNHPGCAFFSAHKCSQSINPHAVLKLLAGYFTDVAERAGRSIKQKHFRFAQSFANQVECPMDLLCFTCIRLHFESDPITLADVSRKLAQEIGRACTYGYGVLGCETSRECGAKSWTSSDYHCDRLGLRFSHFVRPPFG